MHLISSCKKRSLFISYLYFGSIFQALPMINNLNMKKFFIAIVLCHSSIAASPCSSLTDTIAYTQLDELTIEAAKVIRKAAMDVYTPSKKAVENSKDGMQLLSNLMIPTLTVSDALGTIKSAGQQVQIRINGREGTIDQLRTLLPETIRRVEWIENPSLRYNGAPYVLNFIVSNPTTGGSLMAHGIPALNVAWGQYRADLKLNTGRSQWQIGGNYKITNKIKTYREFSEIFTYPDGTSLERKETTESGRMDYPMSNIWASYNYLKPDTTVFIAEFSMPRLLNDNLTYHGILSLSYGSENIQLTDTKRSNGSTPQVSLYLQQNLDKKRMLIFNLSGSFYYGNTFSDYQEKHYGSPDFITDIHIAIHDQNQAYAAEADYLQNWDNSRLSAGISWHGNRNCSKYRNLGDEIFHQSQDKMYFFGEYFHRFGKWTATAGLGLQYTAFHFRETNRGNHSWSPRPQASITFSPNANQNFYLDLSSWQTPPSLAETNIVPQQIDGFQWISGNQDLKTYDTYRLSFRYAFNTARVNGTFGIYALSSPNAIAPVMQWEGDRLMTTYENSHGKQSLSFSLSPQFEIIPGWVTASGSIRYNIETTHGSGYKCHYNDWDGNVYLQLTHWGFILTGQYSRENRSLWGERITWGESLSLIDLTYNLKNWQFCAGIMMPFGEYDRGSKSLNRWNSNEQHIRLDMRIPYIQVSYNLQWGRQKRGAGKLKSTNAETERSSAAGR